MEFMGLIKDEIGVPAMWEQLAEECAELSHAALKAARILRGENPTPVNINCAYASALEEYNDVLLCANELELKEDPVMQCKKLTRAMERIAERK